MHHFHSHSHGEMPATEGMVIRWATFYNAAFGLILGSSEKRVVELAQIKPGNKVLDAGCGPGSLSIRAKTMSGPTATVYGVDASPEMIELARQKAAKAGQPVNFQVGVIEAFPFEDNTFDVVLNRLVIHHLPGDLKRKGFAEMYRVLKPGGHCLVVDFDPTTLPHSGAFLKPFSKKFPMINIDMRKYLPLMEEAGFSNLEFEHTGRRMLSFIRGQKAAISG